MYYEGHRELHDIIFLRRIAVPASQHMHESHDGLPGSRGT
jgi:hypothetical protein